MGKWVLILLAVIVGLAVLGFLVDAARVVAGIAIVVCLVVLGFRALKARRG